MKGRETNLLPVFDEENEEVRKKSKRSSQVKMSKKKFIFFLRYLEFILASPFTNNNKNRLNINNRRWHQKRVKPSSASRQRTLCSTIVLIDRFSFFCFPLFLMKWTQRIWIKWAEINNQIATIISFSFDSEWLRCKINAQMSEDEEWNKKQERKRLDERKQRIDCPRQQKSNEMLQSIRLHFVVSIQMKKKKYIILHRKSIIT